MRLARTPRPYPYPSPCPSASTLARLPLVPKRSTIGGFALLAFLMVLVGTALWFSYAGRTLEPAEQVRIQAVVAGVLVVLGGVALAFFVLDKRAS